MQHDDYFTGGFSPSYGGMDSEDNIAELPQDAASQKRFHASEDEEIEGGFPSRFKITKDEYDESPDKSYYKRDESDPGMYRVSKANMASQAAIRATGKALEFTKPIVKEVATTFASAATQAANEKAANVFKSGAGGCGCGLTYAGAAEIYAGAKGLPMTGTLGGWESDEVDGGCCGFVSGGALDIATIRSYDRTINSVTKDQLVDDIIAALTALGLKASGSDRNAKVASILSIIPNQRKNGKSFKADSENQAKICKNIAKVINDRYGRNIVDMDAEPAILCQVVSEIAHTLRDDIHLEFIMVQDEVKRVLKNIMLLKTQLEQQYQQLNNKIANSKDTQLQNKSSIQLSLHKMILDEITRQIVMLQNLVDVTLSPADVDIAKLLTDSEDDVAAIIQGIERGPRIGTTQFGEVISKVLTGLGVTAGYAAIIEKALKDTGITIDEYAKSPNLKNIKQKIEERLLNDNLKDKDLHEYLKSAELLYKNFYRAKDIASVINKNKSGGHTEMSDFEEHDGGGYCAEDSSASAGEWKTGLDHRVKDKRFEKQVIFKAFNRQINEQFDVIVKSLNVLASKIGSEIPITEQLDGFRDAISKLKPLLNSKNAFISLIGYYNDAVSKERRETFVAQLRMINTFVESLMEMSIYSSSSSYFRDIHSKISELMKTIDQYSDRITAKYGSGEEREAPIEGGEGCEWMDSTTEGGGYGGMKQKYMPEDTVSRTTALTIRDAITKFDYYYKTAQVKDNLAHSSKELQHYAENYTETRATAIAKKIDYARKMRDDMIKDLDDDKKSPWFIEHKQEKKYIKKFLEKQTLGLVNFWRTVEAIDEYMRVFTDGIARHPEEVKDIKDMLDETEVIYEAYDDETGNELVRVFEMFPNCVSGYGVEKYTDATKYDGKSALVNPGINATTYSPDSFRNKLQAKKGSHYYDAVSSAGSKAQNMYDLQIVLPGNPYLVIMLHSGNDVGANVDNNGNFEGFKHIRAMMGRFMILKNLMNVFIHIGSKFGGKEIYRDNFMKPAVIYRNLLEYLEISAFGMSLSDEPVTADIVGGGAAVEGGSPNVELTYVKNKGDWSIREQEKGFGFDQIAVGYKLAAPPKGAPKPAVSKSVWTEPIDPSEVFALSTAFESIGKAAKSLVGVGDVPAMGGYDDDEYDGGAGSVYRGGDPITYELSDDGSSYHVKLGVSAREVSSANMSTVGPSVAARLSAMQRFGIYMRSVMPAFAGCECFQEADQYFVRIIKCLCAKVLTTVGMYDVLKRPYEPTNFSPVRMVLGAGAESPQIVDGAVELYFRLPLLAEFYRDLFSFNAGDNQRDGFIDYDSDKVKITMLPELEGMFSGLIKIIFRRNRENKIGEFTDEELKSLISEINKIYSTMHSRHGDKTTLETVQEFVKEMNMRYGVIKKKDRDLYEETFGNHYDYADFTLGDERPINLKILPGEEDMDYEMSVNPSLKYEKSSAAQDLRTKTSPFAIKYDAYKLFTQFRCMVDNYFMKSPSVLGMTMAPDDAIDSTSELKGKLKNTGSLTESFRPMIQATRMQVKMAQTADEKFELVAKMLRGSMSFENAEASKYLMFHETVITGLDTLSGIYTILKQFQSRVIMLDYEGLLKIQAQSAGKWTSARIAAEEVSKYYFSQSDYTYDVMTSIVEAPIMGALYKYDANGITLRNDSNVMLTLFIEAVFAVSRDLGGLVDMKVVGSGVSMNFSNISETIEKLFESVKYFIDILRPYIKEEADPTKRGLMDKYIGKTDTGSYYWLQEQLIEKLLKGRDRAVSGARPHEYVGLPQMQKKLSSAFKTLQGRKGLGPAISDIAWWTDASSVAGNEVRGHDMSLPINKLFLKSTGAAYEAVYGQSARYTGLYEMSENKFGRSGSIVMAFNDLIAKYLYMFYDGSSEKIYKTTVESFVSAFNQEIMNPSTGTNTLRDMSPISTGWDISGVAMDPGTIKGFKSSEFPPRGKANATPVPFQLRLNSPAGSQILLESLAVMLKNIVSSRSVSNQSYIYMLDNMAEVSMYMKERYKANMPLFKNMFAEVLRKSEFMKELMEKHELQIDGIVSETGDDLGAKESRALVSKVMTSIIRGCMAMNSCIDSVMREIADDPKYLETRAGSIAEYKNTYGKEPIAPVSILTLVLQNIDMGDDSSRCATLPFESQGTSQGKFRYGTRGVLARYGTKVGLAHMPGFKKIVDTFNMTVNSKFSADAGKMESYVENLVKLLRFANEFRYYKSLISIENLNSRLSMVLNNYISSNRLSQGMYSSAAGSNITYSISQGYDVSMNMVESSDQTGQIADVCVFMIGKSTSPADITIRNIIDLNIVPINVNAMMRDIPLVNMYNYEWTFNRMVIDLVFSLQDPKMASKMIQSLCVPQATRGKVQYPIDSLRDPRQQNIRIGPFDDGSYLVKDEKSMFASMLINPYRKLWSGRDKNPATQHHQLLHNMMSGRSLVGLGRPKFLSDQLYNKALLKSVYGKTERYPGTEESVKANKSFYYPKFNGNGGEKTADDLRLYYARDVYDIISQLRLDTVLCRDLMFITDSYRILRLKLRNDFMYNKDVIVNSHGLIREDVTEFELNLNK